MTLVVIGTGTDVGKTVVCSVVLARHGATLPLAYWKAIASGARDGRDTETVATLTAQPAPAAGPPQHVPPPPRAAPPPPPLPPTAWTASAAPPPNGIVLHPETCLFEEPLSPHLAARLAGQRIDIATVLADFERHRAGGRGLLIETAGGLLVPLADDGAYLQADLLVEMARRSQPPPPPATPTPLPTPPASAPAAAARFAGLACLLVGHSGLGTINHTLLTLEALRARGLAVAAVVLNGPPNPENRRAIESYGHVAPVLELPPIDPLSPLALTPAAAAFDPDGHLTPWLKPDPYATLTA